MQAIRIQHTLKALEILELFLEMIKTRLEYLAKQREIPEEMRSSIMSIAYASTRLTDIPELKKLQQSFEAKFGRRMFSEVTQGNPGAEYGIQAQLLYYLSVEPPQIPLKVDAALAIMDELGTLETSREDLQADLEKVRS